MKTIESMQVETRIGTTLALRRKTVFAVLAFLVALRLFLTGDRDILALNSPYDEYWFVHNAARMIWGGQYSQLAFAQLPIYSIWLAGVNLIGIPARLAIDVAWIGSTGYCAYGLLRFTGKRWVAALFWVLAMFHPLLIVLFDRALSETLLTTLMALLVGAGLEVWNTRSNPMGRRGRFATWTFALGLALAFHIRKEGIVLFVPLIVIAVCSWIERRQWWRRPLSACLGGRLIGLPLVMVVLLGLALSSANYFRWGVAARYELDAPEYKRAIASLNRIDVGRTPLYVTVTRKARELAYENSAAFRELRPFFEGESGRFLEAHTAKYTGQQGEIGNGWFYWALRDAAATAGWHASARLAESKYSQLAHEIESACQTGKLKCHSGFVSSFLDPDYGKWVARVPGSTLAAIGLTLEVRPESVAAGTEDATPKQFSEYVQVVGRRNPLPSVVVRGWIVLPEGSVVGLGQPGAEPLSWTQLKGPARPDVPSAFPFSLSSSGGDLPSTLRVRTPDGKYGEVSIRALREGAMGKTDGEVTAALGIDELSAGHQPSRVARWISYFEKRSVAFDWVAVLSTVYQLVLGVLAVVGTLAVVAAVAMRQCSRSVVILLATILAALAARAGLFGLLDASSWNGVQARYMAPLIPLGLVWGVLGCWVLGDSVRKVFMARR